MKGNRSKTEENNMTEKRSCATCRYSKPTDNQLLCCSKEQYRLERKLNPEIRRKTMWASKVNPLDDCPSFVPQPQPKSFFSSLVSLLLWLTLGALLFAVAVFLVDTTFLSLDNPNAGLELETIIIEKKGPARPKLTQQDIERSFKSHVEPMIKKMHQKNEQAVSNAINHFKLEFQQYKGGVPDFVADLTTLGTKFHTLFTTIQDTVDPAPARREKMVEEKFSRHIMSSRQLDTLVKETIEIYMDQVEANRNELLSSIDVALRMGDVPLGNQILVQLKDPFLKGVNTHMIREASKANARALSAEIVGLIAAGVAGKVAQTAIPMAVSGVSSMAGVSVGTMATQVLASGLGGLAALEGATTAGAAGSILGPAGTVGGVVVGLGVGLAIEIFLTKRFSEKATADLTAMLDKTEKAILFGNNQPNNKGLQTTFREANNTLYQMTRDAVLDTMKGAV